MKLSLSIVLPAYNEGQNLPSFIDEIIQTIKNLEWDFELIIVNDGSKDNTREVVLEAQRKCPEIVLVDHPVNLGYGSTLVDGFNAAKKEWIFFTDSDRQFDIKEISKLAELVDQYDLIIGYRSPRKDKFMRLVNGYLLHLAALMFFGLNVKDVDCAFKLIKREIIEKAQLESRGAFINTELLIKAKRMGYKIKELPVTHYPRIHGTQTGANFNVMFKGLKEFWVFRFKGRLS